MKSFLLYVSVLLISLFSKVVLAAAFFNVSSDSITLTVQTTLNHYYPIAGLKVSGGNFQLTNTAQECKSMTNGFCIFPASRNPTTFSISGDSDHFTATLCLNGIGQLSCQNFPFSGLSSIAKWVYVTNEQENPTVSLCALDKDGLITTCQDASNATSASVIAGSHPQALALSPDGKMAYITAGFSSGNTNFYQCHIGSNGIFDTCEATPVTSPSGYKVDTGMIELHPTKPIAYLGDAALPFGRVIACPISNNIISGNCIDTAPSGSTGPNPGIGISGITFNKDGTKVYLASYGIAPAPGMVTICSVKNNGYTFEPCIVKTGSAGPNPVSFKQPGRAVLNASENLLYITDYENNAVYACDPIIDNSPLFSKCTTAANINHAWGLSLNKTNTMAYVADYTSIVSQCPIMADGTFGTCVQNSGFHVPVQPTLVY